MISDLQWTLRSRATDMNPPPPHLAWLPTGGRRPVHRAARDALWPVHDQFFILMMHADESSLELGQGRPGQAQARRALDRELSLPKSKSFSVVTRKVCQSTSIQFQSLS